MKDSNTLNLTGRIDVSKLQIFLKERQGTIKKLHMQYCSLISNIAYVTLDFYDIEEVSLINSDLEYVPSICHANLSIKGNMKKFDITDFSIIAHTDNKWLSLNCLFSDCENLEEIVGLPGLLSINKHKLMSIQEAFKNCYKLKSIDFGDEYAWDSRVGYSSLFVDCKGLESINLGNIGAAETFPTVNCMFTGINPDVKLRYTGKFKIDNKDLYEEYPLVYNENIPNTPNPFTELFEEQKDIKALMQMTCDLLKIHHLNDKEIEKIPIIKCKTKEELQAIQLKQELLGTTFLDLIGGRVYFSSNKDNFIIVQKSY